MSLRKILVAVYALLMVVVAIAFIRPLFVGQVQESQESKTDELISSEASVFQPLDNSDD